MHRLIPAAATAALALSAAVTTAKAADLTLSSPDDLTNVSIGQTVTINLNVANLGGDQLSFLFNTTTVPSALFATPGFPTAGAIVPNPDTTFTGSFDPTGGFVDGTFVSTPLLGPFITDNGTFYSFDITADAAGMGSFGFGELATGLLADGSDATINAGGPLAVNVVVPEPATAGLLLGGAASFLRRRRA